MKVDELSTEIYFNRNSKDSFQDKLLKVVKRSEKSKIDGFRNCIFLSIFVKDMKQAGNLKVEKKL